MLPQKISIDILRYQRKGKSMAKKTFVFFLLYGMALFPSCQNDPRWYPSAEVSIHSHFEYTDQTGAKALLVTLEVRNTSDTTHHQRGGYG
jgi:hypothetical protein